VWVVLPSAGGVGETVSLNIRVEVEILQYYKWLAAEKVRDFVQIKAIAGATGITTPTNRHTSVTAFLCVYRNTTPSSFLR
jgi:hypothetical protein